MFYIEIVQCMAECCISRNNSSCVRGFLSAIFGVCGDIWCARFIGVYILMEQVELRDNAVYL